MGACEQPELTDGGPPAIRVVAADDSYLIRGFLTLMLARAPEVELLAVCANGTELNEAIATGRPDVVVTDIRMPPSAVDEGIRVTRRLRESNPETGVVVLSQYAEPGYALAVFDGGSARRAYLLKERLRDQRQLIEAIEKVARGGSVMDPMIVELLIQARRRAACSRLAQLTAREREVLAEIATGKSNAAIADSLLVSKRAIEKHVHAIFSKLDLPASEAVSQRVTATLIFLAEDEVAAAPLRAGRLDTAGGRSEHTAS